MSKVVCIDCGAVLDDCELHKEVDREYVDGRCMDERIAYVCPYCYGEVEDVNENDEESED